VAAVAEAQHSSAAFYGPAKAVPLLQSYLRLIFLQPVKHTSLLTVCVAFFGMSEVEP
jgi:hypothetical protein